MTEFYVLEWASTDVDDTTFEIHAFGKTMDGSTVVLRIDFYPYFFVKTPGWSVARQKLFLAECVRDYHANERYSLPITRKDAWGYSTTTEPFVQLAFDTLKAQRICRSRLSKSMATYEGTVDPVVRLCHVRNIAPTGWICAVGFRDVDSDDRKFPRADYEVSGIFTNIGPSSCKEKPPVVLCSWDIEVMSHDGSFPIPEIPENHVIQIACAFQNLGDPEPYRSVVICLHETSSINEAEIVSVGSEADVYVEWLRILKDEKVDVFMGWNTWQFDWKYIAGRISVLTDDFGEELVDMSGLGRGPEGAGETRTWELNSGAYGQNHYILLKAPGVLDLDLMQLVKREKKLDSYSLNNVSKKFLGDSKLDLPAKEIFRKFLGTPDDRADIARYAVQDVLLPLRLFAKLNMYDNLAQMSVATCVPMDYLLSRGQQIKVFSLILRQARTMGYVLPDGKSMTIEGKFEGATVLEAKKGAYFDVISGLDFASLYPSILRSYNMCYSTLVLPGSPVPENVYEIDTGLGVYTFAQDTPGIVPELLKNLAVWRKDAKKKMAECKDAGDAFGASVWDGAQLAFKVSMNSVYGFLGASHGFLPCVPIAAAVTATGRLMIEKTKAMAESLVPGSEVVYGDSVAGYTPLLVRQLGHRCWYTTFDQLADELEWIPRADGKETAECLNLEVWSDQGWTRLERLIRHAAPSTLVRIVTGAGLVDVTQDHSLVLADKTPAKPSEVSIGTALLHNTLPDFGCCSLKDKAVMLFSSYGVDNRVLRAPHHIRESIWKKIYQPNLIFRIEDNNHLDMAMLVALGDSLGYEYKFESAPERPETIFVSFNKKWSSDRTRILHMDTIPYSGKYVYDCTTANHHFAAGPGLLVVHNTDSVMVKFKVPDDKRHDMKTHFEVAQRVAAEISKTFPGCVELEFEKCYYPYCLYSKKRYAGLMYTKPEKHDYIDVKGLQLVRRDNAPIVKIVSQGILDAIMYEKSTEKALDAARKCVLGVISGQNPLENFVVSKSLRGSYVNPNAQPHVQVARKIKERTGESLGSGERVPYVFVVDNNIDGLISSRAEDPTYVVDNNIDLDYLYYLENQLMSPIKALLEVLVKDPVATILTTPEIARIVDAMRESRKTLVRDVKRVKTNVKNNQHEITKFFKSVN
jgi:DNA polymerase elongation subunit (family B)